MSLSRLVRRSTAAVAIAITTIAAAGCSTQDVLAVGDEGTSMPLALRVIDDSTVTDAVAFAGTVRLAGGCVSLEAEGELYTTVWAGGGRTTWDPDLQQITMQRSGDRDDLVVTVGELAELGGTITEGSWEESDNSLWEVKPNADCPKKLVVIS